MKYKKVTNHEHVHYGLVRTIEQHRNEIYFSASDIAKCLGYAAPYKAIQKYCLWQPARITVSLDPNAEVRIPLDSQKRRVTTMQFISFQNMFGLVEHSKFENKYKFLSWLYDIIQDYHLHEIASKDKQIQHLQKKIDDMHISTESNGLKNNTAADDNIKHEPPTILIRDMARLLRQHGFKNASQQSLSDYLHVNGYLAANNSPTILSESNNWIIASKAANNRYIPKITEQGQNYLLHLFDTMNIALFAKNINNN